MTSSGTDRGPAATAEGRLAVPRAHHFRGSLGRFATGVAVVTFDGVDRSRHGITVNSFTSVSHGAAARAGQHRAQHQGPRRARAAARSPSTSSAPNSRRSPALRRQARARNRVWVEGEPAPAAGRRAVLFDCTPWAAYDGGDHTLYLGEVADFDYRTGRRPRLRQRRGSPPSPSTCSASRPCSSGPSRSSRRRALHDSQPNPQRRGQPWASAPASSTSTSSTRCGRTSPSTARWSPRTSPSIRRSRTSRAPTRSCSTCSTTRATRTPSPTTRRPPATRSAPPSSSRGPSRTSSSAAPASRPGRSTPTASSAAPATT